jgi:hypothetical protein
VPPSPTLADVIDREADVKGIPAVGALFIALLAEPGRRELGPSVRDCVIWLPPEEEMLAEVARDLTPTPPALPGLPNVDGEGARTAVAVALEAATLCCVAGDGARITPAEYEVGIDDARSGTAGDGVPAFSCPLRLAGRMRIRLPELLVPDAPVAEEN